MAACTLDLSRSCFVASLASLAENEEIKNQALASFKSKVEKDHRCCHRVVQKFYGNKKFVHLHEKIWKYDWGESSASSRKAWRMVVVVPEPDIEPYNLIGAAVYTKSVSEQLSFKELASIFDNATKGIAVALGIAAGMDETAPVGDFRRVSNGDGKTLSMCGICYTHVAVAEDPNDLDMPEEQHCCDLATDSSEDSN